MTEPLRDPEDEPFGWASEDDPKPEAAPSRDLRRVGVVLGVALVILVTLLVVLLQVLGNVFGDMWDSVFTF